MVVVRTHHKNSLRFRALLIVGGGFACGLLAVAIAWASTLRVRIDGPIPTNLSALACPPSGVCVAEGGSGYYGRLFLAPVSRAGKKGKEVTLNNLVGTGIACPSANFCVAIGYTALRPFHGVIIPVRNGSPGRPIVWPRELLGLSCGSPPSCWATTVGNHMLHIVGGRVVHDYRLPVPTGQSGACVSASLCYELGATRLWKVLTISNGRVLRTSTNGPSNNFPLEMRCQTATYCVIAGEDIGPRGESPGLLATVSNGQVGPLQRVPGTNGLQGLNCSATICFAFWTGTHGYPSVMVPIANGVAGKPISTNFGMSGAVCRQSTCLALGGVFGGPKDGLAHYFYDKILTFTYSAA